ncbi:MAG: hypothetical protein GX621_07070, partial [Pirellulaceae bacterium]|nr:hypothetical protein [Pirellulaceae bacterium]
TGLAATWAGPIGWPLLVAGVLHLGLIVERRHSLHALLAAVLLLAGLAAQFHDTSFMAYRGLVPVHLLILAILVIGVVFKDPLAEILQRVGIAGLLGGSLAAVTETAASLGNPPAMLVSVYPLAAAAVAVVFLLLTANREYLLAVFGGALAWLVKVGWPGYQQARNTVEGLDKIVLGGLFLLIALAISLGKAGLYRRIRRRSDK